MNKVEIGEGWELSDLKNTSEDPDYDYLVLRKKKNKHIRWLISHPGSGDRRECGSFEECMDKWFEGFNIPYKVENNIQEPFADAHKRVTDWIASRHK